MANPMREKRTWPPDRDSDGETAAAFEAAVAVVKESVVRSGEVLSSAREDLSDHQRWLKAQAAAVESDRERLARWLQRQRERQDPRSRSGGPRKARYFDLSPNRAGISDCQSDTTLPCCCSVKLHPQVMQAAPLDRAHLD